MGLYHTPGRVGSYGWGLVAAWVASGAWYTPVWLLRLCVGLNGGFYCLLVSYRPLARLAFSFFRAAVLRLSAFLG